MNLVRQIAALLALAIASSGSLPLVVHHVYCHSHASESVSALGSAQTKCNCAHGCSTAIGESSDTATDSKDSRQADVSAAPEECSICFQLSQATCAASPTTVACCFQFRGKAVLPEHEFDLTTVESNYPPRGPPAV